MYISCPLQLSLTFNIFNTKNGHILYVYYLLLCVYLFDRFLNYCQSNLSTLFYLPLIRLRKLPLLLLLVATTTRQHIATQHIIIIDDCLAIVGQYLAHHSQYLYLLLVLVVLLMVVSEEIHAFFLFLLSSTVHCTQIIL